MTPALRPVVNWNIVGGCNYRCSYCIQKHADGIGGPDDARLDAGLDTLCALPGAWEIKISGGEPFLLKRLPEVAARLAASGHKVSILTNLSPSLAVIERFITAAGERLRTFSCSLHQEQVSVDDFLAKAVAVEQMLRVLPHATFVVNYVVQPGKVRQAAQLRRRFEAAGIKFYPQLMRINGAPAHYGLIDRFRLSRAFADMTGPSAINRGYSHLGKFCYAGQYYFIVHPKGDAYTCYPGKRTGQGYLGNIYDGSLQLTEGLLCPYQICPCTVPQNRGIVQKNGSPVFDFAKHQKSQK